MRSYAIFLRKALRIRNCHRQNSHQLRASPRPVAIRQAAYAFPKNDHEYDPTTRIDGQLFMEHSKAALPPFFRYRNDLSFEVSVSVSFIHIRTPRLGNINYLFTTLAGLH